MTQYDSFIGQTFEDRYTIVNVIGIGGMATVYGAYDQVAGRSVAIKMMNKKLEHNARQIRLFINESTALSLLSHPNIVQVYNTAITNSTKYIIMEYNAEYRNCNNERRTQKKIYFDYVEHLFVISFAEKP